MRGHLDVGRVVDPALAAAPAAGPGTPAPRGREATLDELAAVSEVSDAPLEDTTAGRERRTYVKTTAGRERRTYVKTLADARPDVERRALGRIAIRRVPIGGTAPDATAGAAAVKRTWPWPVRTRFASNRTTPGNVLGFSITVTI